jgi:hypothetical protein
LTGSTLTSKNCLVTFKFILYIFLYMLNVREDEEVANDQRLKLFFSSSPSLEGTSFNEIFIRKVMKTTTKFVLNVIRSLLAFNQI